MRSKYVILPWLLFAPIAMRAEGTFRPTVITTAHVRQPTIYLSYRGNLPTDLTTVENTQSWEVWWKPTEDGQRTRVDVVGFDTSQSHKLSLLLSGSLPGSDLGAVIWLVHFNPTDKVTFEPAVLESTPARSLDARRKSCDSAGGTKPYLCPPDPGVPPDVTLSGNFLAAGGTKPIYTFEFLAGLYKEHSWEWMHGFNPGIAAAVEINQNAQPPNNRTRFDPDSLMAALALQKIKPTPGLKRFGIYALQFDEALPAGEFSRVDSASNLVARSSMLIGMTPFVPRKHQRLYATLYPVIAVEAGHNLNKPNQIFGTAVDLSHYGDIVRGVVGVDQAFSIAARDNKSDFMAITTSYRVRLPAMDEPFVKSMHEITTVDLTTKPRHWLELNVNYAPWSFRYLSLNAKYQYGALPPLFDFIDHNFSFGLSLTAVQSNKRGVTAAN